jgi:hypothetical protein
MVEIGKYGRYARDKNANFSVTVWTKYELTWFKLFLKDGRRVLNLDKTCRICGSHSGGYEHL